MTIEQLFLEAMKLSREERIELFLQLWDSIVAESKESNLEPSDVRKRILRHRSKLVASGKMGTHTLEELEAYLLQNKLKK